MCISRKRSSIVPRWLTQVQILMPETLNDGFGVVRTIVRDSTDAPQAARAETFLDSDNAVSQNGAGNRSTGTTLLVSTVSVSIAIAICRCSWHQIRGGLGSA